MLPKAERRFAPLARLLERGVKKTARNDTRNDRASAGQPHHCGLMHRPSCDCWSWTTAFLWWLLRTDR